jgi:hypothetical protein
MFKKELFTHSPNAQFGQYQMSQNQLAPSILASIIEYERPDIVIEIGTQHGGLTCTLRELTRVPFRFITYDPFEMITPDTIADFKTLNIEYQKRDCFDGHLNGVIVGNIDKKIMILCDGGNKNREFEYFSSLLKTDDIIMAHDSIKEVQADRENDWQNFWNWSEFTYRFEAEELKYWRNPWWFWLATKAAWYGAKKVI